MTAFTPEDSEAVMGMLREGWDPLGPQMIRSMRIGSEALGKNGCEVNMGAVNSQTGT